jgi:peptide/nickel transport system substrate-binding protein
MKKLLVPLVMLLVLAFITGCSTSAPTPTAGAATSVPAKTVTTQPATTTGASATNKPTTTTTTGPKYGGTLRIFDSQGPNTSLGWIPQPGYKGVMFAYPMLEGLLTCSYTGALSPKLATSWEVASDLKSITFSLRKGIKFHDGTDFNAAAVKWNLDNLITAKHSASAAWSSIDVIDDYTVRLNLKYYRNTIMNDLAGSAGFMTSPTAYNKNGQEWVRWNPVGTGPFKFTSYDSTSGTVKASKFADYWQKGKPYLNSVEIYAVSDPITRAAALQAGEADAIGGDLTKTEYDLTQKGYPVVYVPTGITVLFPDTGNADSPLSKLKVRQAINYAIDRDAIVKARGYGFWITDYQMAYPNTPAYIKDLAAPTFNPDKAKQLLTEAGYPSGVSIKIYASAVEVDQDAAIAIQGQLGKIGIQVDLQYLQYDAYNNYAMKGWNNACLMAMFGLNANLNQNFFQLVNNSLVASDKMTQEYADLVTASMNSKDFDPTLAQKCVLYTFNNADPIFLFARCRGDVMQSYVRDAGFYQYQTWPFWSPQDAWLDK